MAGNKRLNQSVAALISQAERQFTESHEPQKRFTFVTYAAKSWNTARRVICKVEYHTHGSNVRFVLTTDKTGDPEELYNEQYCLRGEMENKLKQMKLDLESDRMSCTRFIANQFRMLLSSLAYILINQFRRHGLRGTQFANAYCKTIRLKLFKVGAVIIKNTRRIACYFSSHYTYQELFINTLAKLQAT